MVKQKIHPVFFCRLKMFFEPGKAIHCWFSIVYPLILQNTQNNYLEYFNFSQHQEMGFFNVLKPLLGNSDRSEHWKIPESEADIESLFQKNSGLHLIYKHSYACGICRFSLMRLEKELPLIRAHSTAWFIDVRSQRNLSNKVAALSGIRHESPQALFLKDGKVYWSGSHGEVEAAPVVESLKELNII